MTLFTARDQVPRGSGSGRRAAPTTVAVTGLFAGLAPAVVAVVAQAVWRVGRRSLTHPLLVGLAAASFAALALFRVPFPVVIVVAGAVGWLIARWAPGVFKPAGHGSADDGPAPLIPDDALHQERPGRRRTLRILLTGLLLWAVPVAAVAALTGTGSVFTTQGLFFSGTALVTFGGAYAVLAYVAQQAVQTYGWLGAGEMVRGLALAETTPGPLIMVVQFVAFLGAYRDPGALNPWAAALLGALLTTWVTFVPCFMFIFLGAPYIERLRGNRHVSAALSGITAAVVGVIANLALYFAEHTLFTTVDDRTIGPLHLGLPDLTTFRPVAPRDRIRRRPPDLPAALERPAHAGCVRRTRPGGGADGTDRKLNRGRSGDRPACPASRLPTGLPALPVRG